jgi:DNA excision repair protein ERCC-2
LTALFVVGGCAYWATQQVREKAAEGEDVALCDFYEEHDKKGPDALLPPGVYTLHDLRAFGRKKGWCPYFLARHMLAFCNVLVYNYQYLLDPKVCKRLTLSQYTDSLPFQSELQPCTFRFIKP